MQFSFLSLLLALGFGLCVVGGGAGVLGHEPQSNDNVNNNENQVDLRGLAENARLPNDPKGFNHIGDDGILRSFNEEGEVIGYTRLTHDQLLDIIETSPWSPGKKEYLAQQWSAADSPQVSMEQIWQPPKGLLPLRFAEPERFRLKREQQQQQQQQQQSAKSPTVSLMLKPLPEWCKRHMCYRHEECKFLGCFHCMFYSQLPYGDCI
ncbi:hypothetical protein EMCG_09629 [[Emmonsia] crescens]|uniref:Uncharacterized protein n=1 Tax=[Emmonsia] crescens TaxID=73230 RepID=A0A0G2I2M1_9EURO|nr:hypothetical protein EMCG_09629 [Emmonsia crescens UAMH 3008]